jgi:hypothetical protein
MAMIENYRSQTLWNKFMANSEIQPMLNSIGFVADPSDVENGNEIPTAFRLEQNYPNPFNPTTTIKYSIPMSSFDYAQDDKSSVMVQQAHHDYSDVIPSLSRDELHVTLKIYDMIGQEVATLVNENQKPGIYNYQLSINNYQLSSGVYFYQLKAGNFIQTKKMILMK